MTDHKEKKAVFGRAATSLTPDNIPLRVAYQCYFSIIGLTLLILAVYSLGSLIDKLEDYDNILANWKQDVVIDLSITQSECQSGVTFQQYISKYEPISFYRWPGTKPGCDCRDETRNSVRRQLSQGGRSMNLKKFSPQNIIYTNDVCNSTQLEYNCETIEEKNSIDFTSWTLQENPNSILNFIPIIYKLLGYNFYSKAPFSSTCFNGEKQCGSSDPNKFFCVPSGEPCPIVQITLEKQKDWESVMISDDQKIYFTRSYFDNAPMVEFRVSEGGNVCWKNNITHISQGRKDYVLMKKEKQSCTIDPRFSMINEIDEERFYTINNQTKLEEQLNGYEIDSKYKWGLFQRQQIEWKLSCRGDTFYEFIDQKGTMKSIIRNQVGLFAVSLVFFLFISLLLSCVSCANIFGYDWPCISGKGTDESNKIFIIEAIVKFIVQFTHAIMIIVAFSSVQQKISYFADLEDKNCTDPQTQKTIQDMKSVLQVEIYNFNLAQLIIFIITTFLDLFVLTSFVLKYRREMKKKQHFNEIHKNIENEHIDHVNDSHNGEEGHSKSIKHDDQPYLEHQTQNNPEFIPMQINQNQHAQHQQYIPVQPNQQNPAQFDNQVYSQQNPQVQGYQVPPQQPGQT